MIAVSGTNEIFFFLMFSKISYILVFAFFLHNIRTGDSSSLDRWKSSMERLKLVKENVRKTLKYYLFFVISSLILFAWIKLYVGYSPPMRAISEIDLVLLLSTIIASYLIIPSLIYWIGGTQFHILGYSSEKKMLKMKLNSANFLLLLIGYFMLFTLMNIVETRHLIFEPYFDIPNLFIEILLFLEFSLIIFVYFKFLKNGKSLILQNNPVLN